MTVELRAIVVDDEPLARDELVFLLGEAGGVSVVGQAKDAAGALALLDEAAPDVAFVDLRMPGPDGIALAQAIVARRAQTDVIVVSAHDDAALRAFEARVADYLLKPVRLERLRQALERVHKGRGGAASKEPPLTRLAVRRRGMYVVLEVKDVVYFEMKDDLVWAVTTEDRFALDLTMNAVEERMSPEEFFRSHRSALVRIERIRALEPTGAGTFELLLEHPSAPRIPLARERTKLLRERIPFAG